MVLAGGWWRHATRGRHSTEAGRGISRLSRGERTLVKRQPGEAIQILLLAEVGREVPWHIVMESRSLWSSLELIYIDRVLGQKSARGTLGRNRT